MNAPLLAFAAGVALLQSRPELPPWPWLGLLFGAGPGLWLAGRLGPWPRRAGTCLLAALLGFAFAGWRAEMRLAERLPVEQEGKELYLTGHIASLPRDFGRGQRFEFAPDDALAPPRILISWYDRPSQNTPRPQLIPGQRWGLALKLKRPHGNANGAGLDYEAWLLERGIGATGHVQESPDNRLLGRQSGFLIAIERLRHDVVQDFRSRLPRSDYPYAGILGALAVGDQQAIPGDQWRLFAATGTTHLMSISGLHVTMLAGLAAWVMGRIWRRFPPLMLGWPAQSAAIVAGWLAAAAYTLLAGSAVPALRTLAMLSAGALALFSGHRVASGNILAFALAAVLLWDPWAILSPGFWLSFLAVGALLLAARPSRARASPGPLQRLGRTLADWGLAQWAATLGTLPLLLLFFQQFSLVSPLANALAIPVVSLVVTPLTLAAALLPLPGLAEGAHLLLEGLMAYLDWLALAPGARWTPPAPGALAIALAVPGTLCLLLPRGFPGRWLGGLMLLPLLTQMPLGPPPGSAWVTVLDVGQGLAVAVRTAGHTLLYDAGPYYSPDSDAGERLVVPWLRAQGVAKLDLLVVTHRDSDHAGGAASVLETLPTAHVLESLPPDSRESRTLLPLAPAHSSCQDGQSWEWDGVRFATLYPPEAIARGPTDKANHWSCVLAVSAGGRQILLTSDIEKSDEAWLLDQHREQLASIGLVVPHHGSHSSSTPEFVAAVGAKEVVFPLGYRNRFGHPRDEVVERYAAHPGSRIWRTDRDGAVTLELGKEGISAWSQRQRHPRYWHPP